MGDLKINIEVKQTILSKFLCSLSILLHDYNLINDKTAIGMMDVAFYEINSFKMRINKRKWRRLNLKESN